MLTYYVVLRKKYAHKKFFSTQEQAERYYRELQKQYNTNALYIEAIYK